MSLKDELAHKQNSLVEAPVLLYPLNDITLSYISDKAKLPSEAYKGVDPLILHFWTGGIQRSVEHSLFIRQVKYSIVSTGLSEEGNSNGYYPIFHVVAMQCDSSFILFY